MGWGGVVVSKLLGGSSVWWVGGGGGHPGKGQSAVHQRGFSNGQRCRHWQAPGQAVEKGKSSEKAMCVVEEARDTQGQALKAVPLAEQLAMDGAGGRDVLEDSQAGQVPDLVKCIAGQ